MNKTPFTVSLPILLVLVTWFFSLSITLRAAEAPPIDRYVEGQEAMKTGAYVTAAKCFGEFIRASIGDPRIKSAQEILLQALMARADVLDRAKLPCESVRCLVEYAQVAKGDPKADRVQADAQNRLAMVFRSAAQSQDFDQAVDAAQCHQKWFPDAASLTDADTLHKMKIDAVNSLARKLGASDAAYIRMGELLKEGITEDDMRKQKLAPFSVGMCYAQFLSDQGWYSESVAVLRMVKSQAQNEDDHKKCEALLSKMVVARANAEMKFGNVHRTLDAISEWEGCSAGTARKAELDTLKVSVVKQAGIVSADPHALPEDHPILGAGSWADDGAGYAIKNRVQIGKGGDKDKGGGTGNITVQPGFFLQGGAIYIEKGTLVLNGKPDCPIILSGVHLSCELAAEVQAKNVIFEDCTFSKGGAWFSYWNARWCFTDCLLLRSRFERLTGMDYGLKLSRCTFVSCAVPGRYLWDKNGEDIKDRLKSEWNSILDCDFLGCELMPSTVWMAQRANYRGCRITGPDVYKGANNIDVSAYAFPTDNRFWADLVTQTEFTSKGQIRILKSGVAFPRDRRPALWPWLGLGDMKRGHE